MRPDEAPDHEARVSTRLREGRAKGHLGGWGGHHKMATPFFARTSGESPRRRVEWILRGKGTVTIRAGGARVGHVEAHVEVGTLSTLQ